MDSLWTRFITLIVVVVVVCDTRFGLNDTEMNGISDGIWRIVACQ